MPGRPRADGTPARAVNKRKLTDTFVLSRKVKVAELVWDTRSPGLALAIRPSGRKVWRVIYRFAGRPRWLTLGDVRSIGLADARRLAARIMFDVAEGKDPVAERQAERAPAASPIWPDNTSSYGQNGTTRAGSRPRSW